MLLLLRAQARRDRWQLLIWIAATALLALSSAASIAQSFGDEEERTVLVLLASSNPALLAIRGIPQGAGLGSLVFFQIFTYLALLAGLMSTFLTVRHSRGDEELGRSELIDSTPVSRSARLTATLSLGLLANLVLAAAIAGAFVVAGLPFEGSVVAGMATGATGLVFCGVAALAAQLARTARAANALAGALVGAAFLLRAIGDALGTASPDGLYVTSSWPSWLSPIGWGQQTHAFTDDLLWPLLPAVGLTLLTAGAAIVLVRNRDLGSGLIGDRAGRSTASTLLRGSFGLAWRLQWGGIVGWGAGGALLGLFAGGLAELAVSAVSENASLAATIQSLAPGGKAGLLDTFVALIMTLLGVLAAGAAVQAVLRLRPEEAEGRAELLLSAPLGRMRWLLQTLLVAMISIVSVVVVGGLAAGLTFLATGSSADRVGSSLAAALVQIPAALVYAGLAAFLFAVLPRLSIGLGWGLFALGVVLGEFGALFKLPDWVRGISPFTHTPIASSVDFDWAPIVILTAAALVLGLVGLAVIRRRNLTP